MTLLIFIESGRGPQADYSELRGALSSLNAQSFNTDGDQVYLVKTDGSPEDIYKQLRRTLDDVDDKIYVLPIADDVSWAGDFSPEFECFRST